MGDLFDATEMYDTTNRAVLDGIVGVLRPGGKLAMDLDNLTRFLASYCPRQSGRSSAAAGLAG